MEVSELVIGISLVMSVVASYFLPAR